MTSFKSFALTIAGGVCLYLLHSVLTSNTLHSHVVAGVSDGTSDKTTAYSQVVDALSRSFREVAKQTLPAVVSIRTVAKLPGMAKSSAPDKFGGDPFADHPFFRDFFDQLPDDSLRGAPKSQQWQSIGQGSGFIIDPSGVILTNAHVVNGASEVTVQLSDGREFIAKDVKADDRADVAIVRIMVKEKLPTLVLGDEQELEIGDWVLAFGSPFGLHRTVTQGIISAKARGLNDPRMKQELLQTDAAINPGNSGGPLVNLRGEVIGVNTAISTSSGGYDGVGFAVPASLAKWVAEQLEEHGKVRRAYLGVMAQDIDSGLAESLGQDTPHGALVAELTRGAPAEKAGLRVQDIVTELNGQQITNTRKLMSVAEKLNVGQKYTLVFLRNGKPQAIEVTMAELPERLVAQESETTESETSGDGTSIDELGLTVRPVSPELAEQLKLDEVRGVVITSVKPDSYAASLGIQVGDVIFRMGSVDVNSDADVQKGVEEARENRRILLYIKTATGTRFISVPLVTQP
jgi:serine protease Do